MIDIEVEYQTPFQKKYKELNGRDFDPTERNGGHYATITLALLLVAAGSIYAVGWTAYTMFTHL